MLKFKLRRTGRKNKPFYLVIIGPDRARDSKFIEKIGYYDPRLKTINRADKMTIDMEKVKEWKMKGAQPTLTIEKFIRMKDPSIYGPPIEYKKKVKIKI